MNALLDTNAFLFAVNEPEKLTDVARAFMSDANNQLFLSAASGWEIAIKASQGKLKLGESPEQFIAEHTQIAQIGVLPVLMQHALKTFDLPKIHTDPFDRLLVTQAMVEDLPIITSDPIIKRYKVNVIW